MISEILYESILQGAAVPKMLTLTKILSFKGAMVKCVTQKFQDPYLQRFLVETGTNTWQNILNSTRSGELATLFMTKTV